MGDKIKYYEINEQAARRAKEANSFRSYVEGSATAEYRQSVDKAYEIAEKQKTTADSRYHDKIDVLVDKYARKLADNMNKGFEIEARVPSVMIAGPANFPVRKKEKQNTARSKNIEEWRYIQEILQDIKGIGTAGISADDPDAIENIEAKIESLEKNQEHMKSVNAYYRKHKTLDGCPDLTDAQINQLKSAMKNDWRTDPKPYESYMLTNNNANIRRLKGRVTELKKKQETEFKGWEFGGGHAVTNKEDNRLQLFFDEKPREEERKTLKSKGFRWTPSIGAWQRQLNDNSFYAADRIDFITPLSGEKPSELQRKSDNKEHPSVITAIEKHKANDNTNHEMKALKSKNKDIEI